MPRAPDATVQSVARALLLVEALVAAREDLGVSELAATTALPVATVHRLLATLVEQGYARRDPGTRRYGAGARLVLLGADAGRLVGSWVRPWLADLVERSGETANLAVLEGDAVVYVAQVPSRHKVRMFTEVGNRLPPHSTAAGKVLLAFRPRAQTEAILARTGLPSRTGRTTTSAAALYAELDAIAKRGWALDDEEEEVGVCCLAVPVFGLAGSVGAISVSGPAGRLEPGQRERILPAMLQVAAAVSAAALDSGGDGARPRPGGGAPQQMLASGR